MDQQQQRRVNQAAEEFASAVKESYRAVSERGQTAYEPNAQLTEQFFNRVVENLRRQTEANRQAGQALAEQAQRGQEASRQLAQESLSAYTDFLNAAFSFAQAAKPQAAKEDVREGGEEAQRMSSRETESPPGEDGGTAEEDRRSLKEELRGIVRESVHRSEAGIGEEPQEEDGGTEASEEGRAAAQGPPIEGYDSMNVEQISNRLGGLSVEELERLRRYEAANKDRSTLHRRIDNLIASRNT